MTTSAPPLPNSSQEQPAVASGTNAAQPLHITIIYQARTITLHISDALIIADVLPDIARRLGVLDPSIVYGGFRLLTAEGDALSLSQTFAEQHVPDNSTLTLEPGVSADTDLVYDDVVEAVGASVQQVYRPWTAEHTTFTSLLMSTGMLVISIVWLALFPTSLWTGTLGLGFAAVLIALCAVIQSKSMAMQASVIGVEASAFAAVGGYHLASALAPAPSPYAMPMVGAGIGLLLAGSLMTFAAPRTRPYGVIPITIGLLVIIPAVLCSAMPGWTSTIWIITATLAALAANVLPWMCLSFARLSVQSPHSDAEIFALPEAIDYQDIKRRYIAGSTMLFIGRVSVAAILLIAVPLLSSLHTVLGSVLCLVAFLAMLLDSRQIYALRDMVITTATAGIGIICTGLVSVRAHQQFAIPLTIVMMCCAFVTIMLTHVTDKKSLFATRVADMAETLCIMALPPLAYLAITA